MKIMHVVGARPNFMKIAPLIRRMSEQPAVFSQLLVHTGQHYDDKMSEIFFQELELPKPDVNLAVGSGTHAYQTAQIMMKFEPVLREFMPDWVIVPGDVNSTLACALVCSKLGVKLAHLEAGLRSFDRSMPEEINRVVTDHLSELLLTPSRDGDENLAREGVPSQKIHFVGNIMIDTLVRLLPRAEERWASLKNQFGLSRYVLATLHRPSNVDDTATLTEILGALQTIASTVPVIFPIHPRTRRIMQTAGLKVEPPLQILDPLGYLDFLAVQAHSALVLTDSGGVQEETTFLGIPCLTLRPNTERPVTITAGSNRLVASTRTAIEAAAKEALAGAGSIRRNPPELWDGRTANRIAEIIAAL
jgi:UDP-N-acetylglucosamine 2-epimerase (non-hydrolysing)